MLSALACALRSQLDRLSNACNNVLTLRARMPAPSEYGKSAHWLRHQGQPTAVLCLRPPEKQGLPLLILHDVFRQFVLDLDPKRFGNLAGLSEVSAAKSVADSLCAVMGRPFESEATRRSTFESQTKSLFPNSWEQECSVSSKFEAHKGKIDSCFSVNGVVCIMREDKAEPGQGNGDAYIQLSRGYQMYVTMIGEISQVDLIGEDNPDNLERRLLLHGAPTFLVCVIGESLPFHLAHPYKPAEHL